MGVAFNFTAPATILSHIIPISIMRGKTFGRFSSFFSTGLTVSDIDVDLAHLVKSKVCKSKL